MLCVWHRGNARKKTLCAKMFCVWHRVNARVVELETTRGELIKLCCIIFSSFNYFCSNWLVKKIVGGTAIDEAIAHAKGGGDCDRAYSFKRCPLNQNSLYRGLLNFVESDMDFWFVFIIHSLLISFLLFLFCFDRSYELVIFFSTMPWVKVWSTCVSERMHFLFLIFNDSQAFLPLLFLEFLLVKRLIGIY